MTVADWLLLSYRVPNEPSKARVYVWRKLKRLGALLLQDAIWLLPATSQTREQYQWLAAEIVEMMGEAIVWEAEPGGAGQSDMLRQRFIAQAEAAYGDILNALNKPDVDLAEQSRRFVQVQEIDYFRSPLGEQVRAALKQAAGREGE